MNLFDLALIFTAALLAGALNAIAGGGSFFSFPALLVAGVPPIVANATNALALWPGTLASVGAYRRELSGQQRDVWLFSGLSLIGGLLGAILLLFTDERQFTAMIPYLLLFATLVFIFSPQITRLARRMTGNAGDSQRWPIIALYIAIAIYGGFFGAGLGILTLAALALLGHENIHRMNALKTLQAALVNGIAVATFIATGLIAWMPALVMTLGAIVGGYGGAAIARRVDARRVRGLVVAISIGLTVWFFARGG
ncbi:sulfite exporter TauE/SafE family protein [Chloroflexus sp.]|uniref:sulfite exporter TauE/SafE family protein n=1 Tax=Chloroflexus sp. TaxID=1904827 RepID=UPI00262ECE95|nr:sulfite exporter TauE/SafE family protein [uncultured Chloroflexus sp.]